MNEKTIQTAATICTIIPGAILLLWFLRVAPAVNVVERIPGMDNRPSSISVSGESVAIDALFASFDGIPSGISGSWPRFR